MGPAVRRDASGTNAGSVAPVTYRTQENPYAQVVSAARQAVEIRDAARELDWQRGRAEAIAALRDFAEVVAPAVVYLKREDKLNGACTDLDAARSDRVSLLVRSSDDRVWVARHLCEIVWSSGQKRWLRIGAPVGEDDGTLAAILMRIVSASDFGDHLSAVTSARELGAGTQPTQVAVTSVCPRKPRWYAHPANYILPAAAVLVTAYLVWASITFGLWPS